MDNQGMQVPMGGEMNQPIGNTLNAEEAALEAELK